MRQRHPEMQYTHISVKQTTVTCWICFTCMLENTQDAHHSSEELNTAGLRELPLKLPVLQKIGYPAVSIDRFCSHAV